MAKDSWFSREWKDISGNVKFWIAAKILGAIFGGGTVAAVIVFWQRVTGLPPDTLLPAVACVVCATLFYFCLTFVVNHRAVVGITTAGAIEEYEPPLLHKFSVQVLEGYAGLEPKSEENVSGFGQERPWLLLKIRLTPRTPPGTAIKLWDVSYLDGDHWREADIGALPENLEYAVASQYGGYSDSVPARPGVHANIQPAQYGSWSDGFLLLEFYADFVHELFRYKLRIRVVDALDEESFAVVEPGSWLKPAQFSFTRPLAAIATTHQSVSVRVMMELHGKRVTASRVPRGARSVRAFRSYHVRDSRRAEIAYPEASACMAQEGRRQSESARAETEKRNIRTAHLRQLERLIIGVPGEFRIGQSFANDLRDGDLESLCVCLYVAIDMLPMVVAKSLLVNVAEQVETAQPTHRFHRSRASGDSRSSHSRSCGRCRVRTLQRD
jgi:hypothetical protein